MTVIHTLLEYSLSVCCFFVFSGMYFQFEEYKVGKFVRVVIGPVPKLYSVKIVLLSYIFMHF